MTLDRPPLGSRRTHFGARSELFFQMSALARAQEGFIDLCRSNPAEVGLAANLSSFFLRTQTIAYQPDPRGSHRARTSIAQSRGKALGLDAEDLMLTSSTSEAYSFLLLALCDPGDAILVPTPSYPLFEQLAQLASVRTIPYRIAYDGAWHVDRASLPNQDLIHREKIRFVVAVSPNNPTGNILRKDELASLRSLGLPLVVDEVFRPYSRHRDSAWADPLELSENEELTVVLDGLSKRCLSPGAKLGWLIARGTRSQELWERLEWVSDTFLSVNSQIQAALPGILIEEETLRAQAQVRIARNLEILDAALTVSALSVLSRDGGWSALLRLPDTQDELSWWKATCKVGLWMQPGHLYDLPMPSTFVISLLTPEEELRTGLARLARIVADALRN